ncbi:hypothetical protein [Hymenobacter siberiensis]|jgi:hypothetical protein|uniref:hypothetical protein n=1 Tax=Hymenobacter siberiensis TaxID=2848396 RepID=UPI001C1E7EDA|nr:hypothetical protein [Hymenobacter siberiensis]
MRVLCIFLLSLLPLLASRPAPPPCGPGIYLRSGFEGYYAVYWNGHLVVHGTFEYNMSIGMSMRRLKNGEIEDKIGFCVGKVADHNELVVKNRAGKIIFRRLLQKREVKQNLSLDKYESLVSLTLDNRRTMLE